MVLYSSCLSYFCSQHCGLPISSINERKKFPGEIPTAGSERQDRVCRSESEQERSDGARGDYAEGR